MNTLSAIKFALRPNHGVVNVFVHTHQTRPVKTVFYRRVIAQSRAICRTFMPYGAVKKQHMIH